MRASAEHRADVHILASRLRAQGRPIWSEKLNVQAVFHNESLTFEERRDSIVAAIKRTAWYKDADPEAYDGIREVTDHLADAIDVDEFDGWWDELYDLADYARVWITTQ